MKKNYTLALAFMFCMLSLQSFASIEIYCPKDKDITYQTYTLNNYWDAPVVTGPHTLYGPWVYPHLNCGSGYVDIKWEIVDHYARSYYCTQTIWVTNGYGSSSPVSVWCPKEQTVYCDEVNWINYAKPEVSGYNYTIYGPTVSKSLNDCGIGSLWVEWKVVDGCGKATYCKSVVWVKARKSTPYIYWPKDFEADPCKDNVDPKYLQSPYGYPDISESNSCAKYGINYKDEVYTFPNDPGICKKIVRRWTIIDWCTYNLNGYGNENNGKWEHVQLIKFINKTKPTITCSSEIKVNQETYGNVAWVDIPVPKVTSTCNGGTVISHNSKFATKPSSSDASGNYPLGTTEVIFTVTDACSNFSTCTTKVIVLDKTPPIPYCVASLITTIAWHSDGIYTLIDPKKFDLGSSDNITASNKLVFQAEPSKFLCDSIGVRKIKIWVIDEAGNKNYCTVKITLQDNQGMCPKKPEPPKPLKDTLVIAGLISNAQNQYIDSVSMALSDSTGDKKLMSSGTYKFNNLNQGMTYTVKPSKTKDFLDGITTEDYSLLADIVQGKDSFNNPYQMIASDIDGNDTINLDDVFLLGYYLLSKGVGIPATQESWRFLPKNFNLSNVLLKSNQISTIPQSLIFEKMDSMQLHADFLGIKIGDINLSLFDSIKTSALISKNLEQRNSPSEIGLSGNLIKIFPNPFNESVTILFNSDKESRFSFMLTDISGRTIHRRDIIALKGLNQIFLTSDLFNSSGMFFFNLNGLNHSFSGKLFHKD